MTTKMSLVVDARTGLSLIEPQHADDLFKLIAANREYLSRWHPWVDKLRSVADVQKSILQWLQHFLSGHACYYGIWFEDHLCGMVNYISVDWSNQWAALSYWLDAGHQGKGIMTACCSAMIAQAFEDWMFNRITIECATENTRSRALVARLGFEQEGIVRGIEWLQDHYADHAMYGLLRATYLSRKPNPSLTPPLPLPWLVRAVMGEGK